MKKSDAEFPKYWGFPAVFGKVLDGGETRITGSNYRPMSTWVGRQVRIQEKQNTDHRDLSIPTSPKSKNPSLSSLPL